MQPSPIQTGERSRRGMADRPLSLPAARSPPRRLSDNDPLFHGIAGTPGESLAQPDVRRGSGYSHRPFARRAALPQRGQPDGEADASRSGIPHGPHTCVAPRRMWYPETQRSGAPGESAPGAPRAKLPERLSERRSVPPPAGSPPDKPRWAACPGHSTPGGWGLPEDRLSLPPSSPHRASPLEGVPLSRSARECSYRSHRRRRPPSRPPPPLSEIAVGSSCPLRRHFGFYR